MRHAKMQQTVQIE